jgi:hypothetical protein
MSSNDKGVPILFPVHSTTLDINRYKDADSGVYVYTELKGTPTANYCDKCNRSYYAILTVNNQSIMNTNVKISRCVHSGGITPYLRFLRVSN